ncbi:hypothetical protein CRUP_005331 [Coryphaenoides rupestris]|nr:hypothetical protein CRUP_005331 [Coryphaenoides rupestris]
MCIRCAGIHRNLGVHIARVKSSMVDMGNRRARQLYEAHLPEGFRRPQTDQAMEVFIRDKYERKKYYDKDAPATAPRQILDHSLAAGSTPRREGRGGRDHFQKEHNRFHNFGAPAAHTRSPLVVNEDPGKAGI